ncbi:MAG: acsA, partial [Modestobacter sp.]|nr:acsA [Modestobacter sp.]
MSELASGPVRHSGADPAAGPEVLWSPTPESIAASGLGRFAAWVAERRGLAFGTP